LRLKTALCGRWCSHSLYWNKWMSSSPCNVLSWWKSTYYISENKNSENISCK